MSKQRTAAQKKGGSNSSIAVEQMYTKARNMAGVVVKQGGRSLEDVKGNLAAMRERELSFGKQLAAFEMVVEAQEAAFEALFSQYPPMLEELGPRRSERMDSASKFNQTIHVKREASLRHVSRQARKHLEETKQRTQDATDATNLIKSYKALLRF